VTAKRHSAALREVIPQHLEDVNIDEQSPKDFKFKYFEAVKYEIEASVRLQQWDNFDPLFEVRELPPLLWRDADV
jgi:hypothetical protein